MEYNINFCIISAAYLSVTAFFYARQARIPSRRTTVFNWMLGCCLVSIALDIAAAVMDRTAALLPSWSVWAVNIVFLGSVQLSGALFCYYSVNLSGGYRRLGRTARGLILLPFAGVALLLLSSPFWRGGIFTLDAQNVYHHGPLHPLLYVVMALYLLVGAWTVFRRRAALPPLKRHTILAFLLVTAAAMLIQYSNPYLLVNSMANAFALTLIYHILEAPSAHVDALTGVLNRTAFQPVLRDAFDEGERCTLLVYSLNTIHLVNHSFGIRGGDQLLQAYAAYLRREFPHRTVFRLAGNVFGVLLLGGGPLTAQELAAQYARTRDTFRIHGAEVTVGALLTGVNSEDCGTAEGLTAVLEDVLHLERGGWLLADGAFRQELERRQAIQQATERALDEDRVEVYYQPIHDSEGRLCALEALVRINDPALGFLPPQELVELAERSGSIIRLGEQVLRRTCAFVRDNDLASWGLHHVGVNLSAVQCVRPELPDEIADILAEYNTPPGLIAFEITETAVGAMAAVRENMERMRGRGLFFLLDDFGTGYANFRSMAALPYRCIKLDKSLLWEAPRSPARMQLLTGVVRVIHALGLTSLCEGVETCQQAELLRTLGVSMLQGYLYDRPLPPEALLAYAERVGVRG